MDLISALESLVPELEKGLGQASSLDALEALRVDVLGRKQRKRDFRTLWILRINAGARLSGLSYSRFMHGLKQAGIELNRKVLADLAVYHKDDFAKIVDLAKAALN